MTSSPHPCSSDHLVTSTVALAPVLGASPFRPGGLGGLGPITSQVTPGHFNYQ